jgi:hypothetical protein
MIPRQPSSEYWLPKIEVSSFWDSFVSRYLFDTSARSEVSSIHTIPEEGTFIEDYGLLEDDDSIVSCKDVEDERDIESHPPTLQRARSSKSIKDQNLVSIPFFRLHSLAEYSRSLGLGQTILQTL